MARPMPTAPSQSDDRADLAPYGAKLRTCFWFESGGLAAARYYTSLLPHSAIDAIYPHGNPDDPMIVEFTLQAAPMMIMTMAGPYRASPAASISVLTKDQAETDHLWSALIANGGAAGRCGWLCDAWGLSWQIIPTILPQLLGAGDRAAAGRARAAMMQMDKIEIAALQAAFDQG